MSDHYTPPFTITDEILNMVIEIGELVGQIDVLNHLSANLKLRRENRIKTIYSSLAIEQNTLTLEQITLVKSCIFHYEFEFIHPFADGNVALFLTE